MEHGTWRRYNDNDSHKFVRLWRDAEIGSETNQTIRKVRTHETQSLIRRTKSEPRRQKPSIKFRLDWTVARHSGLKCLAEVWRPKGGHIWINEMLSLENMYIYWILILRISWSLHAWIYAHAYAYALRYWLWLLHTIMSLICVCLPTTVLLSEQK